MNRSIIRHALYRAKNGIFTPEKQHIYDLVKPEIPMNESWETFTKNWDVYYKNGVIKVIRPEVDYDFIHSTCLEKSLHVKNNLTMTCTDRQMNTIEIIELNMLEGKMDWSNYNKTWGVSVDHELKRINTKLFSTSVNVVTDEMIKNSAKSDGAAMVNSPSLDEVVLNNHEVMTEKEIKAFKTGLTKNKRKHKDK